MPVSDLLHEFQDSVRQCDGLIANAHKADATGSPILPARDQRQITVAAFLNLHIAWEAFLEGVLADLMTGGRTTDGFTPVKYVSPLHIEAAKEMVIGAQRYFDYANHENVRKIVKLYFEDGRPFEPHLSATTSTLNDMKTLRNAAAHISSSTQRALEALAVRILGHPKPGITLYELLTTTDPHSASGETVYAKYRDLLSATAELIAKG